MYGVVGIAMVQWLYFVAIARLPVGVALLLEFTAPVLVALWAQLRPEAAASAVRCGWRWLLRSAGSRWSPRSGTGCRSTPSGCSPDSAPHSSLATYYIAGKHALVTRDTVSLAFWAFVVSALFWSVAKPWWTVPWDALDASVQLPGALDGTSVTGWALITWVVVLGTVAPFLMVIGGLSHLAATEAGIAGMIEPVLAGAVAWVWLDETLTVIQVIGSLW